MLELHVWFCVLGAPSKDPHLLLYSRQSQRSNSAVLTTRCCLVLLWKSLLDNSCRSCNVTRLCGSQSFPLGVDHGPILSRAFPVTSNGYVTVSLLIFLTFSRPILCGAFYLWVLTLCCQYFHCLCAYWRKTGWCSKCKMRFEAWCFFILPVWCSAQVLLLVLSILISILLLDLENAHCSCRQ